jgi:transcriptional regulator with XRE-family HTH domain
MKPRKSSLPTPVVGGLHQLGAAIRAARVRRRQRAEIVAQRAGIGHTTLIRIERGEPTVAMGSYAAVLWTLGLLDPLTSMAQSANDVVGLDLEESRLPQRVRRSREERL